MLGSHTQAKSLLSFSLPLSLPPYSPLPHSLTPSSSLSFPPPLPVPLPHSLTPSSSLSFPPPLLPPSSLTHPFILTLLPSLSPSPTATDEDSDTRRLLGEEATSHKYGSSSSDSLNVSGKTTKGHSSPWSQPFAHLLSLAQTWKRQKMIPRNRRIDINSGQPPSGRFCSNRMRYRNLSIEDTWFCPIQCVTYMYIRVIRHNPE